MDYSPATRFLTTQKPEEKSILDSPVSWTKQNVVNPFVNSLFVDTWNGLSGTVVDVSRGGSQSPDLSSRNSGSPINLRQPSESGTATQSSGDVANVGFGSRGNIFSRVQTVVSSDARSINAESSGNASIQQRSTNPVHITAGEVGDQSSWLNWGTQTIFSTAGSAIKYVVAGKVAGAALRKTGAMAELEGTAGALARNDSIAQIFGATTLAAAEKPREGETRLGNITSTAFSFGVFEGASRLTSGMSTVSKLTLRATAGTTAGAGQELISAHFAGRAVSTENLNNAMLAGGFMGVAMPKLQDWAVAAGNKVNLALGRGVYVDRYIDANFRNDAAKSESLQAFAKQNAWARVQDNAHASAATPDNMRVFLGKSDSTPQKLGHELAALSGARNPHFEQEYQRVAGLLKTAGGDKDAALQFREIRLRQEIEQLRAEHSVASELGLTSKPFNEQALAPELSARTAFGTTTYEQLWQSDFAQFKQSGGTYRPKTEYGGKDDAGGTPDHILAERAVRILQEGNEIGVFAGGAVRDKLMGRAPKDYDIATSATPERITQLFEERGITVFPRGEAFGVMAALMEGKQFEIATLRKDGASSDGRRPQSVEFVTSLKEDAARRDLTINQIFHDPVTGNYYDFFGGQRDIQNKVLRAVGDPNQRFYEDRLRMLRVPRFAARYPDFTVDPATARAIKANAPSIGGTSEFPPVSAERIKEEIRGILTGKDPARGMRFVMGSGLMHQVIPEMVPMRGPRGRQDPLHHPEKTAWTHTMMVLDQLRGSAFEDVMAGFMHDIGKPKTQLISPTGRISNLRHDYEGAKITEAIMRRLKFTTDETAAVTDAVRLHMKMHAVQEMTHGKLAHLLERPDILRLVRLQHADSMATFSPDRFLKTNRDFLMAKLEEMKSSSNPAQRLGAPSVVTGDTLIEMGYKPGPAFKQILEASRTAQYEGGVVDAATGRRFVTENFSDFKGLTLKQQQDLLKARAEGQE